MKILFHICCANCAIYPAKTLREDGHSLTGFWFNPNIHPYQEYKLRLDSLKGLVQRRLASSDRWFIDVFYTDGYKPLDYFKMFNEEVTSQFDSNILNDPNSDYEAFLKSPPQSPRNLGTNRPRWVVPTERCKSCYRLRLEKTAEEASKQGFDAFTTTLLISPYQDFGQIVTIGKELAAKYNVFFYLRDFRPFFRESMAISKELGLYRQKYCGCIYSREERRKKTR